jgi:hypothetical protein
MPLKRAQAFLSFSGLMSVHTTQMMAETQMDTMVPSCAVQHPCSHLHAGLD